MLCILLIFNALHYVFVHSYVAGIVHQSLMLSRDPLPSNRQHLKYDDYLEVRRKNKQLFCVVLCVAVVQNDIYVYTHTCEQSLNLHVGLGLDFILVCLFMFSILCFLF